MENKLLKQISAAYPLTETGAEPVCFQASGMDFATRRYQAVGLGSVSLMEAQGMGGKMNMTTLIVNPFEVDAPLLSVDRISAMGAEMLYLELFDTTLEKGFETAELERLAKQAKDIPDQDPGEHWYDSMRVGTPVIKKGGAAERDRMEQIPADYLNAYLNACKEAPACDQTAKREKAKAYSEGLLIHGGPATDPVKAALGADATADFFRKTLFGTDTSTEEEPEMTEEKLDIAHFQNFWKIQQQTAKHMERDAALAHIVKFIENHNTCALATGIGDFVRCTPIEYTYMDGEFYLYSEGGDKFIGLEKNPNVSLAIFEYYGDKNDSHGLQVMGEATLYPPRCELFKKVLAFKGIPYDVMKAAKVDVALIRITPKAYEMYDTDFVKAGYDVRQIVRF